MSAHTATALSPTTVSRAPIANGSRWYEEPAWVILCSCGAVCVPYRKGGTAGELIDGPVIFREHATESQR